MRDPAKLRFDSVEMLLELMTPFASRRRQLVHHLRERYMRGCQQLASFVMQSLSDFSRLTLEAFVQAPQFGFGMNHGR